MTKELQFNRGEAMNFNGKSAKGEFTLHGDPEIKIEKPYTVVKFPGGCIEIARTDDNEYWAHISINKADSGDKCSRGLVGQVVNARIDAQGRYMSKELEAELNQDDMEHIAIKIRPVPNSNLIG